MKGCDLKLNEREAELNRQRVKKHLENKDRICAVVPKGTIERIRACGMAPSAFTREVVLAELEKQERLRGIQTK